MRIRRRIHAGGRGTAREFHGSIWLELGVSLGRRGNSDSKAAMAGALPLYHRGNDAAPAAAPGDHIACAIGAGGDGGQADSPVPAWLLHRRHHWEERPVKLQLRRATRGGDAGALGRQENGMRASTSSASAVSERPEWRKRYDDDGLEHGYNRHVRTHERLCMEFLGRRRNAKAPTISNARPSSLLVLPLLHHDDAAASAQVAWPRRGGTGGGKAHARDEREQEQWRLHLGSGDVDMDRQLSRRDVLTYEALAKELLAVRSAASMDRERVAKLEAELEAVLAGLVDVGANQRGGIDEIALAIAQSEREMERIHEIMRTAKHRGQGTVRGRATAGPASSCSPPDVRRGTTCARWTHQSRLGAHSSLSSSAVSLPGYASVPSPSSSGPLEHSRLVYHRPLRAASSHGLSSHGTGGRESVRLVPRRTGSGASVVTSPDVHGVQGQGATAVFGDGPYADYPFFSVEEPRVVAGLDVMELEARLVEAPLGLWRHSRSDSGARTTYGCVLHPKLVRLESDEPRRRSVSVSSSFATVPRPTTFWASGYKVKLSA